jgi:hypothetical protein
MHRAGWPAEMCKSDGIIYENVIHYISGKQYYILGILNIQQLDDNCTSDGKGNYPVKG